MCGCIRGQTVSDRIVAQLQTVTERWQASEYQRSQLVQTLQDEQRVRTVAEETKREEAKALLELLAAKGALSQAPTNTEGFPLCSSLGDGMIR